MREAGLFVKELPRFRTSNLHVMENRIRKRNDQVYHTQQSIQWCLTHSLTHSLTRSLTHSLTHPPTHSPTHPLTHSPTHSPTHPLTHPPTHSPTHSLTHSPTHPLTHPLTPSPTHPLTHSLTPSPTHSLTPHSHPLTRSPSHYHTQGEGWFGSDGRLQLLPNPLRTLVTRPLLIAQSGEQFIHHRDPCHLTSMHKYLMSVNNNGTS